MDAHTPQTSPSQALHGMPVAGLLGYGKEAWGPLITQPACLLPKNMCLIGVRSFESGEAQLLHDLGVRVFHMSEVDTKGFKACFEEALALVTVGTDAFGITVDLDGFDPRFAPGVGSLAPGGLNPREVLEAMTPVLSDRRFKALEIAEFNPTRDQHHLTQDVIISFLKWVQPRGELS